MKALKRQISILMDRRVFTTVKLRDVYDINDDILVMVATDRISAFDVCFCLRVSLSKDRCSIRLQLSSWTQLQTSVQTGSWLPDPMVTHGFEVQKVSAWR